MGKQLSWQEYTLVAEDDNTGYAEIMVHFDEKGKLLRAYCYKDNIPCFQGVDQHGELTGRDWPSKTTPSQNALFVNLPKTIYRYFDRMLFVGMEEEEFKVDKILQAEVMNYKKLQFS